MEHSLNIVYILTFCPNSLKLIKTTAKFWVKHCYNTSQPGTEGRRNLEMHAISSLNLKYWKLDCRDGRPPDLSRIQVFFSTFVEKKQTPEPCKLTIFIGKKKLAL